MRSRDSSIPFRHLATRILFAQHIFQTTLVNHIYDNTGKRLSLKTLLQGTDADIWNKRFSMELGSLAQGNDYGVKATDTIDFIDAHEIPT